jgi:cytochrome-b5 reductase
VERLTPETSLFKLEVPRALLPAVLGSDEGARPILSLFVKEPTLQIQRAYTVRPFLLLFPFSLTFALQQPLSASSFNSTGPAELDLVVKRYPDGEASRYIHRLGPGDDIHVRGPSVTWYYRPEDWDEVVFVRPHLSIVIERRLTKQER